MKHPRCKKILSVAGQCLLCLLVLLAFLGLFSAIWYRKIYGDLGFDSILYTLTADTTGTSNSLVCNWMLFTLPLTVLSAGAVCFLMLQKLWHLELPLPKGRRFQLLPMRWFISTPFVLILFVSLVVAGSNISSLSEYISNYRELSNVYEKEYRDPKKVEITFPEEKRNLIYIYLESMETSYFSQEQGGMLDTNVIPELYDLAKNNTNFSNNQDVGGFAAASGATWTIGAMVAQTAGIPLKTPPDVDGNDYGLNGDFLPGVTSLTDILHENGYYQALMVGSDASFGGRREYFNSHGMDQVYDLYTAREEGIIPEDYFVWWGFEDHYLFSYAQQKITQISQQEQPFAFTMLTVDTHHISGYVCQYCGNTREEQYENVMSCSSRQVAAFVEWLKQQPFYENTTIIITGDHPSMDNGYFSRVSPEDYYRHIYNCFINAPVTAKNTKNRAFCTYDMFPTTLAAIGCTIEGDRLGFGTNMYSETPTLLEATNGAIAEEFSKNSAYYTKHFFFK